MHAPTCAGGHVCARAAHVQARTTNEAHALHLQRAGIRHVHKTAYGNAYRHVRTCSVESSSMMHDFGSGAAAFT